MSGNRIAGVDAVVCQDPLCASLARSRTRTATCCASARQDHRVGSGDDLDDDDILAGEEEYVRRLPRARRSPSGTFAPWTRSRGPGFPSPSRGSGARKIQTLIATNLISVTSRLAAVAPAPPPQGAARRPAGAAGTAHRWSSPARRRTPQGPGHRAAGAGALRGHRVLHQALRSARTIAPAFGPTPRKVNRLSHRSVTTNAVRTSLVDATRPPPSRGPGPPTVVRCR